jgi:SAM-dependent methyltransferase
MQFSVRFLVALALTVLLSGVAAAQHEHSANPGENHGDDATIHHRFNDAEAWAKRFEDPERDSWQLPEKVVEALELGPDMTVADIGSATGYFPVRFARACPEGMVFGADIEPDMVHYLNDRARMEGLDNLVSILAGPDDPHLPRAADLVFICNTYHHIDARVDYFRGLGAQLRPGGRVAVVDYRPESRRGPPHKLAPEKVKEEMAAAGYELEASHDFLPEQYFLVFELLEN